jgi:hypothetical protein
LVSEEEIPTRFLIEELLEVVDPVVDELGVRDRDRVHPHYAAKRQQRRPAIKRYEETESMEAVVDMLIEETMEGT